jgi:hypothetical protein
MSRVTDRPTIASTIIRVHVTVTIDIDRVRDQVAAEIDQPVEVIDDRRHDRTRDREINELTWLRYGHDRIPVTTAGWARWRSVRRQIERDLDARNRHRLQTRSRVCHRGPVQRRARTARRVARSAKGSTDDGEGGEGDGGGYESGAL